MIRAFDGVTVSGKQGGGGGLTGKGIWIYDASTLISNSHVEYFYDGIYIGGGTGLTQDVQIVNTSIGSNQGGYDVTIDADASDIMLVGITTSSTRVLNDVPMSRTLGASDNSLGFYAIGDNTACAPSCVVAPSSFSSSRYADWFIPTNLTVHGSLTKGSGTFKIDHPLDPENKYLSHSFVESPDMMNIYNGITITDEHGSATVAMPEYFSALNRDFKYQLTVLGQFA